MNRRDSHQKSDILMLSIVIPLYNKENKIANTLKSILDQSIRDFEIVIIDDGSTDNSILEVKKIDDPRIRLISQANAGVSAARNRGIQEAHGEFIAFLDADDEWNPKYLETQVSLIHKYPECKVFATNYEFRDTEGNITPTVINKLDIQDQDGILDNYFEVAAVSHPPLWTSAVVVNKESIKSVDGFPEGIKSGEDLLTWARLAIKYKIAYCKTPMAYFNNNGPDERGMNEDQKQRNPEKIDYVGEQLKQMLTYYPDIKGLRKYVSLWHKMRCRIFINKRNHLNALKESLCALRYDINMKTIAFCILSCLPTSFSDKIINKFS